MCSKQQQNNYMHRIPLPLGLSALNWQPSGYVRVYGRGTLRLCNQLFHGGDQTLFSLVHQMGASTALLGKHDSPLNPFFHVYSFSFTFLYIFNSLECGCSFIPVEVHKNPVHVLWHPQNMAAVHHEGTGLPQGLRGALPVTQRSRRE